LAGGCSCGDENEVEDGEIESSWLVTVLGAGPTGGEKERKL